MKSAGTKENYWRTIAVRNARILTPVWKKKSTMSNGSAGQ